MSDEVNIIEGIFVGEYGDPITVTLVDATGTAVDVSTYTGTITVTLVSPDDLKSVSLTGSFVTTGADGKVQFTPASGNIDREGDWQGQIKLTKTSVVAKSYVFTLKVGRGLGT